jgi:hypothetical protein
VTFKLKAAFMTMIEARVEIDNLAVKQFSMAVSEENLSGLKYTNMQMTFDVILSKYERQMSKIKL